MKEFLCVKFDVDGTTDVVCKSWMVGKNSCMWPNTTHNLRKLVKNKTKPGLSWESYACIIVCQGNTYERCVERGYHSGYALSSLSESSGLDIDLVPEEEISPTEQQIASQSFSPKCISTPACATPLPKKKKLIPVHNFTIQAGFDKIEKNQRDLFDILKNIQQEISLLRADLASKSNDLSPVLEEATTIFSPAGNDAELEVLINRHEDYQTIAGRLVRNDLRSTVRAFLKAFMKKELASQYSWSGLGSRRKRTKKSFRDSKLYPVLTKTLSFTKFKSAAVYDVGRFVGLVLCQVGDWDGGRTLGRKRIADADETIETLTCCD